MSLQSPTLAQVAEAAGVSRMTVSRILRNSGYFSPETRQRVLQAVEKLNYRPNPMVSAFMTYVRSGVTSNQTGVLAYLTSDPPGEKWRAHNVYMRFYNGASDHAEKMGYKLEAFQIDPKAVTLSRLSRILYSRGICGVIVAPMTAAHGHLNLDWSKFSAATIGYSLLRPVLPRASNNQYDSMLLALRELYRLGYRRIGMAMLNKDNARVHYHWSAGYLAYFHHRQKTPPLAPFLPETFNESVAMRWVQTQKPEVIITTNWRFYGWLTQAGYRLPKDIGLVHLDWSPSYAPCAGIDQRPELVAASAVDMVIEQINHNRFGVPPEPRTVLTPGVWVPGTTVASRLE